jgi:hypothetical protein
MDRPWSMVYGPWTKAIIIQLLLQTSSGAFALQRIVCDKPLKQANSY